MKPVNTVTTSSTSPCNMNEPNTINTVSMDGGMPCLRDGWINYYWRAVTRSDTWTQWKVEGGRKSSRDVPVVTVEDRATWLIGFDEFSFRDDTKNLTMGCSILRETNGWTAKFEGYCSGIKLWTRSHTWWILLLKMLSVTCWVFSCKSAGEGRSHSGNGMATSTIKHKNLLHCTKHKSIKS